MSKPQKVLVIGSGPIIIGQAAEFDYAGTQACKALREEGVTSVLVNSNPATIMTDQEIADVVYIEPLTVEAISRIIERERPDGLLPRPASWTASACAPWARPSSPSAKPKTASFSVSSWRASGSLCRRTPP